MSRLVTSGGEIRDHSTTDVGSPDGVSGGTTATVTETTTIRSGLASFECAGTSGATSYRWFPFTAPASGQTVFARAYLQLDALPASTSSVLAFVTSANAALVSVQLTATGALQLWNDATSTQIGSDTALTVATGSWYRVQLRLKIAAGAADEAELLVKQDVGQDADESVSGTSLSVSDTHASRFRTGLITDPGGTCNMWVDDVAVNDSTGTKQTSWPGEGSVVMLFPAEQTSLLGTQQDCSGTTGFSHGTNLANGTNNTPPRGVADHVTAGHSSDPDQIRLSGTVANYLFCDPYVKYGMPGTQLQNLGAAASFLGLSTVFGGSKMAQSFLGNGVVESFELSLSKTGAPADNALIDLCEDDGTGKPGTIIETFTKAMSSLTTTSTWYRFALTTPLPAYRKLWVVLRRSGADDASNTAIWMGQTTTDDPSGFSQGGLAYARPTTWILNPRDRWIRVYTVQGFRPVKVQRGVICHAEAVAAGTKTGTVEMQARTAAGGVAQSGQTSITYGADAGAAGTYPTNWQWSSTPTMYDQAGLNAGIGPYVKTSGTLGSAFVLLCFAGIYAEWDATPPGGWVRFQKTADSSFHWAKQSVAETTYQAGADGQTVVTVTPGDWAIYPEPQVDAAGNFPTTLTMITDDTLQAGYVAV